MKTKIRVLHIDDNQYDRHLVKDSLLKEQDNFELVEANDFEKFEQYLYNEKFDIVLSDFNILGFTGLEILQKVKECCPDMPVIIVTGTGSEEIAIQAMKMGASDYVIKSVNHIRGLAPTIIKVLENKKEKDERKIARAALLVSEEKYRKIFENVQDVFYQIDNTGIITEMSPSVSRLAGFLREEVIGTEVSSFYYDPEERTDLMDLIAKHGEVWDYEVQLVTKTGQVKYASLNAHVMFNETNEKIGIEGSLRDVSERKQFETELLKAKEKAEEGDRLKTAFLHNISHEIRTPMNAIMGFSQLLYDPGLVADKRKHFIDIIINSSNQLLTIISDIISIATIEAGQEKTSETEVHLNTTLEQLQKRFLPSARLKNISLEIQPSFPAGDDCVMTDEAKLIQIFDNLLSNALKFTSEGSILFGYNRKDSELEFFVEDNGIGIPSEMFEEIFKRFRQVETTLARQFGGSGLGLSISKAYVELLGGKMWLKSKLGEGSTFYFTLPYKKTSGKTR